MSSLARRTDLIFARFSGQVRDRGWYTVVETPDNPDYYWGNYIIFDRAPADGDFSLWPQIFRREFPGRQGTGHLLFTWDLAEQEQGRTADFTAAGYELESAVALSAAAVTPPPKFCPAAEVRLLNSDADWQAALENQIACADPKYCSKSYRGFKSKQMKQYHAMWRAGRGAWFGAFLDGLLAADLGIFHEDGLGRFQSVCTHPKQRRQGLCGTLVHSAAETALNNWELHTLVMEADTEYFAARIYESVGFQPVERSWSLTLQPPASQAST